MPSHQAEQAQPAARPSIQHLVLAALFVAAGVNHALQPEFYESMMPPWLPAPALLHQIAGAAEVAGGLGLLSSSLRRPAAWGLLALLVAVYPANIQVALHGWPGVNAPPWALWLRLPFQPLFGWWIWRAALRR